MELYKSRSHLNWVYLLPHFLHHFVLSKIHTANNLQIVLKQVSQLLFSIDPQHMPIKLMLKKIARIRTHYFIKPNHFGNHSSKLSEVAKTFLIKINKIKTVNKNKSLNTILLNSFKINIHNDLYLR